jgi:hypothetical protein
LDFLTEEVVGPTEESHTKVSVPSFGFFHFSTQDATSCYLGLATDYLGSFKATQVGLRAVDGVLDTLDRATRDMDDSEEEDSVVVNDGIVEQVDKSALLPHLKCFAP